jgi:hypothetical protein
MDPSPTSIEDTLAGIEVALSRLRHAERQVSQAEVRAPSPETLERLLFTLALAESLLKESRDLIRKTLLPQRAARSERREPLL